MGWIGWVSAADFIPSILSIPVPPLFSNAMIPRLIARVFAFLPALALAHPGHHHPPGEEDEFDQLRADYLHLHGPLEIVFAAVALGAVVLFKLNPNRKVRLACACAIGGSLALIAAF